MNIDMIRAAATRLKARARRTPLLNSPFIDEIAGRRVWVKAECLQHTGSFKFRGGWSALSALDPEVIGEVLNVIRKLNTEHDLTMLMVTHQMGFAKKFLIACVFSTREKSPNRVRRSSYSAIRKTLAPSNFSVRCWMLTNHFVFNQ